MKEQAVLFILVIFALMQISYSVLVSCPDQSISCECPAEAAECEFTFRVNERFSFVSYSVNQSDGLLTDSGSIYFLDDTGYHFSSPSRCDSSTCCIEGTLISDLDFTSQNCSIPMTLDGVNYRSLLLINGRIPGPTLVVHEGQIIIAHVTNQLLNIGITVHWHGMYQQGSPWMDGVGFVTQGPIDSGATFDYIFRAEPSGTHWYHSHIGTQKSDGMFGGLVIRERQNLGDILGDSRYNSVIEDPGSHTMTLIDWQRKEEFLQQSLSGIGYYTGIPIGQVPTDQDTVFTGSMSADGASISVIEFWSGLINGKGRQENNIITPLSIFSVERNNIYHFRMVGSISIFAFRVSVDGHKLMAIASDGEYFEPREVDYMIIHAGETYDFLLEANQQGSNFWIRAETLEVGLEVEHSARAILTYGDSNDLDWTTGYSNILDIVRTCTTSSPCEVLNCPFENYPNDPNNDLRCVPLTSLIGRKETLESEIPRYPPNASCSDCDNFLNFAFQGKPNDDSSINSMSFQLPPVAYSTNCFAYEEEKNDGTTNTCNRCELDVNSTTGGCQCIHILPIANEETFNPPNEPQSISLVLSSSSAFFAHPIHLHGHSFHVVYIGYGQYDNGTLEAETTDIDCGQDRLCVTPRWSNGIPQGVLNRTDNNGRVVSSAIRKDTIIIPAGGYVVVALQANNPGYWIMHCHIEEHLIGGMAVVVQEYSPGQQWSPPEGINLHGNFTWNIDEYHATLNRSVTCNSSPVSTAASPVTTSIPGTPAAGAVISPSNTICISRSGLGVAIAIIVLLVVLVVALVVVIVFILCRRRKGSNKPEQEISTAIVGDIPMSEVCYSHM